MKREVQFHDSRSPARTLPFPLRLLPKWMAPALALLGLMLVSRQAWSQGIFVEQLNDHARKQWDAVCANTFNTQADSCHEKICGVSVDIAYDAAAGGKTVSFNGSPARRVHDTEANAALNANVLNTACGAAATSDSLLVSAGIYGQQTYMVEAFDATSGRSKADKSKAVLRVGGLYEHGAGNNLPAATNGGVVPFSYSRWLSHRSFLNAVGTLSYAHLNEKSVPLPTSPAGVTLPGVSQLGLVATPSLGWQLKDEERGTKAAVGGWLPIQIHTMVLPGLDTRLTHYAIGVGGIATGSIQLNAARLSGGASLAPKVASGVFSLPMNALVRGEYAFSSLLEGFATLGLAVDPIAKAPLFVTGGLGATVGGVDVGYRIFAGSGFTAHLLGVSVRTELPGSQALAVSGQPVPPPSVEQAPPAPAPAPSAAPPASSAPAAAPPSEPSPSPSPPASAPPSSDTAPAKPPEPPAETPKNP